MPQFMFHGYSDDTFGEYGVTNDDHDNCASGKPIVYEVTHGSEGLLVIGQYCHAEAGGWMVGVAPHPTLGDGDGPIPDWPISITRGPSSYTPSLFIEAPEGARVHRRGSK